MKISNSPRSHLDSPEHSFIQPVLLVQDVVIDQTAHLVLVVLLRLQEFLDCLLVIHRFNEREIVFQLRLLLNLLRRLALTGFLFLGVELVVNHLGDVRLEK